ncbi:FAD dependent oxidoreductase [Dactylonectria estremocensis]|uniref:FAD dependent oxidoreductase n=1 Tax=Dactylonectria estremocensis TaxID=1079267 RepID=A0A9P9JBU1_9HYPO|nr:FAD dependent oxidoreductase [Dactylonectria estremocensis]
MSPHLTSKTAPIVIVGAGVFGLSTAIHLAERGYTNVKILDKQAYHESQYSYDKGCDAASADINKIIRAAYGSQTEYQTLALDAITHWKKWNEEISTGITLPTGFSTKDALFINNGNLTMTTDKSLPQFELDTIKNMTKAGLAKTQIDLSSPSDVKRAKADGFDFAINPFRRKKNFGVVDTQGGFVYADKACRFALHKAGKFAAVLRDEDSRITGVRTADGVSHSAELTIMACGGWTPSLVTELDSLCETTAGSVCIWQLPAGSALWDRFAPERFPTWTWDIRNGKNGGLYGFARDANGAVKIGYRGTKYTNPQTQADGASRSVPMTRWTQQSTRQLPLTSARVIKDFVQEYLPELMQCETKTRLCWYTDSFDNHFVIDFVPEIQGLMVATGGSGHGFKFLPNLGKHVVDLVEGKPNNHLHFWKWRSLASGAKPYNSIMEGVGSGRSLQNQVLTREDGLTKQDSRL